MNGFRKSDRVIVPKNSPNKASGGGGEGGKDANQGESGPRPRVLNAESGDDTQMGLERIRQAVEKDKKTRLNALYHHIYAVERLRTAYLATRKRAAAGIDGETWRHYGENLESNLRDLSERLARGAYHAKPVRRVQIPKPDGRLRPLGIPALEDKIVQRAAAEVLNAVYEAEFVDFSYGFRPGRSAHEALDTLSEGITREKISWVLDADIRDFFGTISHEWLIKFVEHRIADGRVVRLIKKWLKAGVLEAGVYTQSEVGTVQGGSISPLLANIYMHYVFDLWIRQRMRRARGSMIVVRYADDFIVGFQYQEEAEEFLGALRDRLKKFGLELHPEKTRMIEFGRFAAHNRQRRGDGKPETFCFLGFRHICGQTRQGYFIVIRHTMRERMQTKLKAVKVELQRRRHDSIPMVGAYLKAVVGGYIRYFGVPFNSRAICVFRYAVGYVWKKSLERRSQKSRISWERMGRLIAKWLPPARICHPYPRQRLAVNIQGKSRMR